MAILKRSSRLATGGNRGQLLRRSLLSTSVSTFELIAVLVDHILNANPKILSSSEYAFSLSEIESFNSIAQARETLRQRKTDSVVGEGIEGWCKWFARRDIQVDIKKLVRHWSTVREYFARRNLLVHKNGVIDKKYQKAVESTSTEVPGVGELVTVNKHYLECGINALLGLGIALPYQLWVNLHPRELETAQAWAIDRLPQCSRMRFQ
jgi:hypothetical protein